MRKERGKEKKGSLRGGEGKKKESQKVPEGERSKKNRTSLGGGGCFFRCTA